MDSVEDVVEKLVELGFFKFTRPSELKRAIALLKKNYVQDQILDTHHMVSSEWVPYDRRIYLADGEELAEEGVCAMLKEIKIVLTREGVHLRFISDEFDEDGLYSVIVNGESYKIYDQTQRSNSWGCAHKRTMEIINHLLASVGSKERAYGIYAANDAMIALLTEELYEYILTIPNISKSFIIYPPEAIECE